MPVPVTATIACLLAVLHLLLEARVIQLRWKHRVSLGAGGVGQLDRAIRGHGNLVEHAPMFLALSLLGEMRGAALWPLAAIGGVFVLGRAGHAVCFALTRANLVLRMSSMVLTLVAFVAMLLLTAATLLA